MLEQETPVTYSGKRVVTGRLLTNRLGLLLVLCLSVGLTACGFSFGQSPEATAEPVALEQYEPGDFSTANTETENETTADNSATGTNATGNGNGEESQETTTANPTAANRERSAVAQNGGLGRYNGEIEPNETIDIAAEINSPVLKVLVEEGDVVRAGQVLVELDSAVLRGQHAQAVAGLKIAQAGLAQLLDDADPEDLEAARAAVNAAALSYQELVDGPREEDLRIAESTIRQSQSAVKRAQNAYNQVKWRNDIGALPQSQELEQATLQLESAQAQYEKTIEGATEDVIAGALAQLVQARTNLTNLTNGADEEQIMSAEAQVEQAEASLYLSAVQLDKTVIRAPMDGVVMRKNTVSGAIAAPGAPLLTLMSNTMNVVISVEEFQLARVEIGQPASIQVNAYPQESFDGEVIRVAPRLNAATRTIEVTIRPSGENADLLRPGMFATVDVLDGTTRAAALTEPEAEKQAELVLIAADQYAFASE